MIGQNSALSAADLIALISIGAVITIALLTAIGVLALRILGDIQADVKALDVKFDTTSATQWDAINRVSERVTRLEAENR